MARPRAERYIIRSTFDVPLEFAFRWCTDYTPDDPGLEADNYQRRILSRTATEVRYEDLDESDDGWVWSRWTVTLQPPDRWHAVARGNYRDWTVNYRLTDLGNGRTGFVLDGRRRPVLLATANPPRRQLEANLAENWKKFGASMLRDYRASRAPRARSRR